MPRLVPSPVEVVAIPQKVSIKEYFGNASCNPTPETSDISMAHVHASGGFAEDYQAPSFDEYVLILKGSVTILHSHGPPLVASANQAIFLAKGERVQWKFTEDAEYVAVCLPAFSRTNIFREETEGQRPAHDTHTNIYHLVQKKIWDACVESGATYYPPTYKSEKFTHATADPQYLIGVANHFYKDTEGEWLCLHMTRSSLAEANITLKFEDPSPVGTTAALTKEQSGGMRFPHIYGGIPSTGGVVKNITKVVRADDGTFMAIEGL